MKKLTPAFSQVASGQNNPDSDSATLVFSPSPRDTAAKKTAAPALVPLSPNAITHIVHYLSEDSVTFDIRERRAQLHNNGSIVYDDMTLEADDIQVDFNRQMLYARPLADSNGKVTVTDIATIVDLILARPATSRQSRATREPQ